MKTQYLCSDPLTVLFSALMFLCSSAVFAAAEDDIVWELENDAESIARALELAAELTSTGDQEVLEHRITLHFGDEDIQQRHRITKRYNSSNGVADGTDIVYWDSANENITFNEVTVVSSAGRAISFNPNNVKVIDSNGYDVFTDTREIILQLPQIAVGALSIVEYSTVIDLKELSTPFMIQHYLQSSLHQHFFDLTVSWDTRKPDWVTDFSELQCEEDVSRLTCNAGNIPPVDLDYSVSYYDEIPSVTIAETTSWEEIGEIVLAGVEQAAEFTQQIEELYQERFAGIADKPAQVRAIHEFVTKEIRYVSFSEGVHSIVPHSLEDTVTNLYGDCKDKATLLWALLDRIDVQSYPTLISTNRFDASKASLPGVAYFDHMIVCVDDPDLGTFCLDPTDIYSSLEMVSATVQGKLFLSLLGDKVLSGTLFEAEYLWYFIVQTVSEILQDGTVTEQQHRTYGDYYAASLRASAASYDSEDLVEWAQDMYQETIAGDKSPEFELEGIDTLDRLVTLKSDTEYADLVAADQPLYFTDQAFWLRYTASALTMDNEVYSYRFPGIRYVGKYSYVVDDAWQVTHAGADLEYISEFGALNRTVTIEGNVADIETEITVPKRIVTLAEKESFNKFLELIQLESNFVVYGTLR